MLKDLDRLSLLGIVQGDSVSNRIEARRKPGRENGPIDPLPSKLAASYRIASLRRNTWNPPGARHTKATAAEINALAGP